MTGGEPGADRQQLVSKPAGDREKLTDQRVREATAPAVGSVTIWDPSVVGFAVRIFAPTNRHPRGARSFFLNYRIDGRERRYTIGEYPTWSVAAAREKAKELRRQVADRNDPASEKRERREAPTVRDLIDRYVAEHLPTKTGGKYRVNDEKRMLAIIGQHLGIHTKVAEVHFGDIEAMHRRITAGGTPVRANRILGIASKMFTLSLRPVAGENRPWRNAVDGNPCTGVSRNREQARERFFSQAELAAISEALAEYPGPAADCAKLIMLTGCRPTEAMKAQWSEFDAEPGYWIKPSAHTKQRRPHKLPLNPPAVELINRLRKKANGPWVFPGGIAGEPLTAMWHVWRFVRDRAGLGADARLYDLRHTFASVGAGGGLSLPIIGKLLGHTQPRTTQRYAHLADDPVREAAEKIGKVIAGAGKGGAKVVPMKG
jgi:integrase